MNFLALVQRVHSESLRSTTAPTAVTGGNDKAVRMVNAVADAWTELQSEQDWKWMRASIDAPLIVGQQTYTAAELGISTRFGRWRKEDETYNARLYPAGSPNALWDMQWCDLDSLRQHYVYRNMGQSTPLVWTIDETERFIVGPAPAQAYQLRADYWKEPSMLAANDDEPDMPARFHMLLVWRALKEIAKSDAAPEVLSRAEANYAQIHDKLVFDQARLPYV